MFDLISQYSGGWNSQWIVYLVHSPEAVFFFSTSHSIGCLFVRPNLETNPNIRLSESFEIFLFNGLVVEFDWSDQQCLDPLCGDRIDKSFVLSSK